MTTPESHNLFSLRGRTIVVTGGSGLFGFPICEALANAGATVIIASRNVDQNRGSVERLRKLGGDAHAEVLDLSREESIHEFHTAVTTKFGCIHVLVNNAVLRTTKDFWTSTPSQWDESLRANITGMHVLTRAFAGEMSKQKSGNIINISSIYGVVGPRFEIYEGTPVMCAPDYSFHRGGIIAYTRYLATLLAPNIRVNCLTLGGLKNDTEDPQFVQRYGRQCPMGRKAECEDVKGPIVFLASDASRYMTGHNLVVDGGWTAW